MKLNIICFIGIIIILFSFEYCRKSEENKVSLPVRSVQNESDKNKSHQKVNNLHSEIPKKQHNDMEENKLISENSVVIPNIVATIKPENQSELSFLSSGQIVNILVKAGDEVKQGQLLASLNDKQAVLDWKSAKIEVNKKKLTVLQQEKVTQRLEKQYKNGIINLATLDKEKNILQIYVLDLNSSQAELEKKEYTMQTTKMYAPYSGVISKVNNSPGDYISPGKSILQITQIKNYKLFSQIPITYFYQIKQGMHVDIVNTVTGKKGEAIVKKIVQVIDPESRTFDVYFDVISFPEKLVPGSFLEIKFNL